ncbi:MAG TPA: pseudouridine synthase [Microvirga sp.]
MAAEPTEDRIAKVIARAGIASRRDVEAMIAEGRVTLNGKVLDSPAVNVTAADTITVDGEPLPAKERTRLWLFHKPSGLVTTARDPEGRPTVFDNLPEELPRVVAVGRLDINTEGLLLLTNDGGLAKVIAHPDTGWLRRYKVRAYGEVNQADLDRLRDGVTIDGMEYGPIEARLDRLQGDNAWISLGLREGKNREVKRILEHLGLQVNRLIRLSFGPFQLGDIEPGLVEEVRTRVLKDQLGDALAAEAGVDFESPVREPIAPFGKPAKPEREERPRRDRDERPERGERPMRGRRDDERGSDRPMRGRREEPEEAPKKPSRLEPKRSVWRAGEEEGEARISKKPRRGADPKEARAATAERARERVGAIAGAEGRKVLVERLVSQPAPAEDTHRRARKAPSADDRPRRPRPDGERPRGAEDRPRRPRSADDGPRGEDRPRRPREAGDRPARPRDDARPARSRDDSRPARGGDARPARGGDRPFRSRDDARPARSGDRPFRSRDEGAGRSERPFRSRDEGAGRSDDRPRRGPPRGDAPGRGAPRGGFGDRPGGGAKGGFKGGPRGEGGGFGRGSGKGPGKGPDRGPGGGGRGPGGPSRGGPKGPPRGRRS